MKRKLLFYFSLLMGFANAQINYTQDFENLTTGSTIGSANFPSALTWYNPNGWGISSLNGSNTQIYEDTTLCNGAKGFGEQYNNSGRNPLQFVFTLPTKSNGEAISIEINDRFRNLNASTNLINCNYSISYLRGTNERELYSSSSSNYYENPSCNTKTLTIPKGEIVANSDIKIVFKISKFSLTTQFEYLLDKISVTQEAVALPVCTTVTLPANGANPDFAENKKITWTSVSGASAYKVYLGTSAGNYNLVNGVSTIYREFDLTTVLGSDYYDKTYFVKIVPTNASGDAVSCIEQSFTTGQKDYCYPEVTTYSGSNFIKRVKFGTIDNNSGFNTAIDGVVARKGYYNWGHTTVNTLTTVAERGRSYILEVEAWAQNVSNVARQLGVYIDFNQNGVFDTNEFISIGQIAVNDNAAQARTVNIPIPTNAVLGKTRMRVMLTPDPFGTQPVACSTTIAKGEVEDYSITINEYLSVSDVNKNQVFVYPNPFKDILNISDAKNVKSIDILDLTGRVVKKVANTKEINLSSLEQGVYIVNLLMEDGKVKSIKVIKK